MAGFAPSLLPLAAKRAFDIVASGLILAILLPLLILVSVAIKLESRGPVISVKRRYSSDNKAISFGTFRCTCDGSVTFFGNVLRRTGIDALPKLISVFRGDMSIVGTHCFRDPVSLFSKPLAVALRERPFRPGLISLDVHHDWARSELQDIEADLFYTSNWSLLLDAKIIFLTLYSASSYLRRTEH